MRVCPDCFTTNPSYAQFCRKCSGKLTRRPGVHVNRHPRFLYKQQRPAPVNPWTDWTMP